MADFETKLRWLSERGKPVGAEELIERIEADLAGDPLVVVNERREGTLMTRTQQPTTRAQPSRNRGPMWALAAFVAILAGASLYVALSGGADQMAEPRPPTVVEPAPSTTNAITPEATELLNGFLAARIAGTGAENYLNGYVSKIPKGGIPLLYSASSGAGYQRAEFEPVHGIDWPYGFVAVKVRLFAGETTVEQLFFMPHHDREYFPPSGRLGLEYNQDGFGTHVAPTTENGRPVTVPYNLFDGEVILHGAHPWVFHEGMPALLIPDGPGVSPTTDLGERRDWDRLVLMADPAAVGDRNRCERAPEPVDARALAESIRSYPDFETTAPVAVSIGGAQGLVTDIKSTARALVCAPMSSGGDFGILGLALNWSSVEFGEDGARGTASGEWIRLYLIDMPEGFSMRVLAIAIVATETSFDRATEEAEPLVTSIEFHAP